MIKENHLSTYKMTLTVKTPVFIGSGNKLAKKEYLRNDKDKTISFLNQEKFFDLLIRKGLVDSYESFVLGNDNDLRRFLINNRVYQQEMDSVCISTLRTKNAVADGQLLKSHELYSFIRSSENKVYVPGSSTKGALRTALLLCFVLGDKNKDNVLDETKYFNKLNLKLKKDKEGKIDKRDSVNSIMRGIYVSDSLPIPDSQMTVAGKVDYSADGATNKINLIRECIGEGARIESYITLDNSVLKNSVTIETIKNVIMIFNKYYRSTYLPLFPLTKRSKDMFTDTSLLLGGGSGFFGKSVIYPFMGKDKAVDKLSNVIFNSKRYEKHKHWQDADYGISPRMLKCTYQNGELVHMGICEVEFE